MLDGGYTEPEVDILGDQAIVLDSSGNVQWVWNPFSRPNCAQLLSIGIAAVLGERCTQGPPQYCPSMPAGQADDWLHTNSISYDPTDYPFGIRTPSSRSLIRTAAAMGTSSGASAATAGSGW